MLTASRKADRAKMAAKLAAAMIEAGATATVTDYATHVYPDGSRSSFTRRISVDITAPGGATVGVHIDGDSSRPDSFVATWQAAGRLWISPAMGAVNPHHFGKLTRCADGIEHLCCVLESDIARFANGSGYLPESDPRIVAMRDRYRANGWQWFGEAA